MVGLDRAFRDLVLHWLGKGFARSRARWDFSRNTVRRYLRDE
jgi:hypothetical protein